MCGFGLVGEMGVDHLKPADARAEHPLGPRYAPDTDGLERRAARSAPSSAAQATCLGSHRTRPATFQQSSVISI